MEPITEHKKNEVKKHVAAIHCSNSLSLLQRKISNALLYHAYHELSHKAEHEITIKQLCNIIGYSGNNHAVIKDALKGLISVIIEWNVVDDKTGEEDWTASAILACANIKGSKCTYAYSPRMKSLLYSPSMYGKINLIVQARFKSSYGLALYENCIRFKGLPVTKWFDVSLFRQLMGVAEDIYPIFRDFKKRVLDKSVEEVNTYSDLLVMPEINRVGRKVIGIRFKLREREKKKRLAVNELGEGRGGEEETSTTANDLTQLLKQKFGLSSMQIKMVSEAYSEDFIQEKIAIIESSASFVAGKITNLSAYLLSALKENYQAAKASADMIEQAQKDRIQQECAIKEAQRKEDEYKQQYNAYLAEKFDEVLQALPETILMEIKSDFENIMQAQNDIFIKRKYQKNGLDDKVVKIFFRNYIKETRGELLPITMSFAEFTHTIANA